MGKNQDPGSGKHPGSATLVVTLFFLYDTFFLQKIVILTDPKLYNALRGCSDADFLKTQKSSPTTVPTRFSVIHVKLIG
jgi:hypothetical protein